jgi:solute carrier family 25 phosphate transporter 23/24/25/41
VATLLACGATSSTCGMLVSYPLQLVRSRLQAQGLQNMPQYNGILDVVKKTVQQDGPLGLVRTPCFATDFRWDHAIA